MQDLAAQPADIQTVAGELLGQAVSSVEEIAGGRNSRVYRVVRADGTPVIVKHYFRHARERRDRFSAEWSGLTFLWEHGIRAIPQPLRADGVQACAMYGAIEGSRIPAGAAREQDIDQAVGFLAELKALSGSEASRSLGPASEACFSLSEILATIDKRMDRLARVRTAHAELAAFLSGRFEPAYAALSTWTEAQLAAAGIAPHAELPQAARMLSPSDFGFHNAVRRPDGSLVFVDFEHFGWDDPAKTIVDAILHPAMELSEPLARRLTRGVLHSWRSDPQLPRRVEAVYPLFGLKWCTILLNEFVADDQRRRAFAGGDVNQDAQQAQLAKAERMLGRILTTYERFSCDG